MVFLISSDLYLVFYQWHEAMVIEILRIWNFWQLIRSLKSVEL